MLLGGPRTGELRGREPLPLFFFSSNSFPSTDILFVQKISGVGGRWDQSLFLSCTRSLFQLHATDRAERPQNGAGDEERRDCDSGE